MTRVTLGLTAVLPGGTDMFLTGVTDLQIGAGPSGPVLYATSGPSGGIAAYGLGAGGFASLDRISLPGATGAGSTGAGLGSTIAPMQIGGTDVLMATGAGGTGLWAVGLEAGGGFTAPVALHGPGGGPPGLPPGLTHCLCVAVGGVDYVYASRLGSGQLGVWELGPDGTLTLMRAPGAAVPSAAGLAGLASVNVRGVTYLLAADSTGNALVSYQIGAGGLPLELDRLGAAQGLGIAAPTALAVTMIDGRAYVLLAAAGSGTLSVTEISASGQLFVRDHVLDDLSTRFQGVTALETITIAGRVYVAAGGADDGISLFELLPGGRLLHLATLADGLGTTLGNVSALALTQIGGDLHILVSSAAEPGITWLTVDLDGPGGSSGLRVIGTALANTLVGGAGADLISGAAGDDRMFGGAGNDILLDGAGLDVLAGGAGADSFVLSVDGQTDRILDFDPNQDRIDLSAWAFLRNTSQLAIMTTADGAEIRFGTEVLRLVTSTGTPLSAAMIRGMGLLDLSRLLPGWFPAEAPAHTLLGGRGVDTLIGQTAGDLLRGNDAADFLTGKGGNDLLYGDAGNDLLVGDEGADALIGGTGLDRLFGGAGADRLWGNDGNDVLYGGTEADTLWGQTGDDFLAGDTGNDLLVGDLGNDLLTGGVGGDRLYAGAGRDKLFGDDGNDILYGGLDADLLRGGTGDDYLAGEAGNDVIHAEAGTDALTGGLGADWLFGGTGRDTLWGNEENDVLYGGTEADTLWGQTGDDYLAGDTENDLLYGAEGADRLSGGAGVDLLYGGAGADRLWGNTGDDTLSGDAGNDRLDGGAGRDTLRGGAGADSFIFVAGAVGTAGADRILDFTDNIDTLVLDAALWGGARLSMAQIIARGHMSGGHILFDFGNGNSLIIDGLPSLAALADDLAVFWG